MYSLHLKASSAVWSGLFVVNVMDKDERKFRSKKRRKRRGFFGKRPQEISDTSIVTNSLPSVDNGFKSACSAAYDENMSTKKLVKTSFEKFECDKGIMDRRNAREVGR